MFANPAKVVLALAVTLALIASGCAELRQLSELPELDAADIEPEMTPQTSKLFDARGNQITTFHGAKNRTVIPLEKISKNVINAVIAIEDERFYEHDGIDVRGIARAAMTNIQDGGVEQGGSTITQQYVKNRILAEGKKDAERTLERKINEAALARQVEKKLSKEEILERYLNTVYFGNGAYGVQAAAKTYFGKPARKLSVKQAATIAGLVAAPETYDPYDRRKRAKKRRNLVLRKMNDLGHIGDKRAAKAQEYPLGLNKNPRNKRYGAPYFVDYVKRMLVFHPRFDFLGDSPEERSEALFKGGLRIHTTLVPEHQEAAQDAINGVLTENRDPYGALVSMDPRTGHIKAIVGGRDFFSNKKKDEFAKLNLAITSEPRLGRGSNGDAAAPGTGRQAGSAFKPFALAAALKQGIGLGETYNAPACEEFPEADNGGPWKVCNYGNSDHGQVTVDEATYKSINVAYAKLVLDTGPRPVVELAKALGIRTNLDAIPSGALGTNPVNVLGMATAYSTFATNGKRPRPVAITRILDHEGEVIYEDKGKSKRQLDPAISYAVTQSLKKVIQMGTGTRGRLGRPAAGKTGTAQEYRDAWFAGYVPQLTAAVWVGYPKASIEMKTYCGSKPKNVCRPTRIQVSGGTWPTEIWRTYMRNALKKYPVKKFKKPDSGLIEMTIDTRTGCPARSDTPDEFREKVTTLIDTGVDDDKCRQNRSASRIGDSESGDADMAGGGDSDDSGSGGGGGSGSSGGTSTSGNSGGGGNGNGGGKGRGKGKGGGKKDKS